jgi:hypothetical protein
MKTYRGMQNYFNSFSKCEDTFAAGTLRTKLFNQHMCGHVCGIFLANVWTRLRRTRLLPFQQTCGHVCGGHTFCGGHNY